MTTYQRKLRHIYFIQIASASTAGVLVAKKIDQPALAGAVLGALTGAVCGIPILARSVGEDDEYTHS